MADERPRFIHCANCQKRVKVRPVGRIPMFCGNTCKQADFVKRTRSPLSAHNRQRLIIWKVLHEAGLVPSDQPPPKSETAT